MSQNPFYQNPENALALAMLANQGYDVSGIALGGAPAPFGYNLGGYGLGAVTLGQQIAQLQQAESLAKLGNLGLSPQAVQSLVASAANGGSSMERAGCDPAKFAALTALLGQMPGPAGMPVLGGFGSLPGLYPVKPSVPTEVKGAPLGFDSANTTGAGIDANGNVLNGSTVNVVTEPQEVIRPERFVIPESIASAFLIHDIKVGSQSQMISDTALPGEAFIPNANNNMMRWKAAQISNRVTIRVENISGAPVRFLAMITGSAVI